MHFNDHLFYLCINWPVTNLCELLTYKLQLEYGLILLYSVCLTIIGDKHVSVIMFIVLCTYGLVL